MTVIHSICQTALQGNLQGIPLPPLGRLSKTSKRIFSAKGVPPTPLTENHFAQKPLTEMGGTPPPP